MHALKQALSAMSAQFTPQLIIYLAGADAHENDRLGKLKLTMSGLAERDTMVFESAYKLGIPVAVTMGGGYGKVIDETVAVHAQTVRIAAHSCHAIGVL